MNLESDWKHSIEVACRDSRTPAIPGDDVSVEAFTTEDVAEMLHSSEGENDGQDWVAIMRLNDGRFAALTAGCDYTGWG